MGGDVVPGESVMGPVWGVMGALLVQALSDALIDQALTMTGRGVALSDDGCCFLGVAFGAN